MQTLTRYAEERLLLLRRLREEANGAPLTDLFRPNAAELRFRLGTSLADLRIPFKLGDDFRSLAHTATIDAFLLAAQRHKPAIVAAEYDKLVLVDGFDTAFLRPLSFNPPSTVTRDNMRRAFAEMMEAHVGVDAGLVASVLGTDRPGRRLLMGLHAILSRAREEARATDTGEPTSYVAALMLRTFADQTYALTREAPIGEPMSRFLRCAVGVLMGSLVRLALRESGLWKDAGLLTASGHTLPPGAAPPNPANAREPREVRSALLAAAALGQLPFLGARPAITQGGVFTWGMLFESPPPKLEETMSRLAHGDEPEAVGRDLAGQFLKDKDVQRRMERAAAMAALRDQMRPLARLLETQRGSSFSMAEGGLDRILVTRDSLEKLLLSDSRRKELARLARDAAKNAANEEVRQRFEVLAHAAREYREDEPAAWLGAMDARLRAARSVVALAGDLLVERHAALASQVLLERTGSETEGGDRAEYETGRLYVVSLENLPLLKARVRAPQVGHLFVDMKDFTRRTAFLKESVIADFIQREFYSPILQAASGQDPGVRGPQEHRSIALNNLLGDAVSFSGDIIALVRLTREIREALHDYARRLESEASQENIAARVKALETQYRLRREAMDRSLRELLARAPRAEPAMREVMLTRAQSIKQELSRQTALFESERARAAGERLEAGVFVSFGAAPEVARFDDPYFGSIKVAIAEKINESARGTARSGAVREKVLAGLARAQRTTGKPLALPFSVHIETTASIPLSADVAAAMTELLARGDEANASRTLLEIARRALTPTDGPGELYNGGAALSEEALRAYLEARGSDIAVVERKLPAEQLHPVVREQFYFPRPLLEVVAVANVGSRSMTELFVFQGRALFKGFEATGGLGIWEMVDPQNPLFSMLAQYHVNGWLGEVSAPARTG